jgi:hypothetical protein
VQIQDDAGVGITGLAAGARATLAAEADTRSLTGTLCALQVDSDVGANNTLPGTNSFIRVADNGAVALDNLFDIPATGCITGSNIKARIAGADAVIPFTDTALQDSNVVLAGTGTSGTPATTATAGARFYDFYTESTATSGDSRGIYWQHFLSGNGATGDCFRSFCKVNSATVAGGFGIHSTLQIQTSSGLTGLGAGARATLAAQAEARALTGTLCALQVDSDIGANNTFPAQTAYIRVAEGGSVFLDNLLSITAGSSILAGSAANNASDAIKIYIEGTGTRYIDVHDSVA